MKSFRERLGKEIIVFDGGTGTYLYEKGIFINRCFEELNLTNPELVKQVHRDYLLAGADVIETNTFGANRFKLTPHGLNEKIYEIKTINNQNTEFEILNNFLFTVRPLKPEFMLVNLKTFLDRFSDFIIPELKAKNIKFKKNYNNLPDVWIDEKLFKQALLNLIQNSIAAIKNQENDNEGTIEIDAYSQNNYVIIEITDNGIGIQEEIQNKIFDPYFTTKSNGTGLGLTIVYKIVKEHNGYISFISKKGETVFSIKIPCYNIEQGLIEYTSK